MALVVGGQDEGRRARQEVGGPDLKIVVNSRDTSSGTYETWEGKVMKKERVTPRAQVMASNGAIVQAVSNNKYAIGYIGIGYLNSSVKPLTVNGVDGDRFELAAAGRLDPTVDGGQIDGAPR